MKNIETIVALATPPGRGGVAIIRVSGLNVLSIAKQIIKKKLKPRYATFTYFYGKNNEIIDQGIALFFPAPHSFTGEDILECHIHGSPIIANQLIKIIVSLGARLAKPGEFSERAFLNNRIDLTQAEAIADLIDASSECAAKNALHSLQGHFSKKIYELLDDLIQLRLRIEAEIDFTEEEINFLDNKIIQEKITHILNHLNQIKKTATQGSLLREGITTVILGEPNVGKSSLLNTLSQRDVAIVTEHPGTTRDILRETIQLDNLSIHLVDTAGLRESQDPIEQEGIRRAKVETTRADLILVIFDVTKPIDFKKFIQKNFSKKTIFVRNKIDLINEKPVVYKENDYTIVSISAQKNLGIDLLIEQIKINFELTESTEGIFSARQRHLDALSRAEHFLQNSLQNINNATKELLADDLRMAQNALNEITGEFTSDDLLGKIFSSFCIGK